MDVHRLNGRASAPGGIKQDHLLLRMGVSLEQKDSNRLCYSHNPNV